MANLNEADTRPSKQFFVSMLTRDIELSDAILDLVDNSLDGALRLGADTHGYAPYKIEVIVNKEEFRITDNCGGIPREIAAQYAFRMGRESGDSRDSQYATIGMYGIGMKRALFKMGDNAKVDTNHNGDRFIVRITPEWIASTNWDPIPFEEPDPDDGDQPTGTTISVQNLASGVAKKFGEQSFLLDLRKAFADHFTMFLQRGLRIVLNEIPIEPTRVLVLLDHAEGRPKPFYVRLQHGTITIVLTIGLNGGVASSKDEIDSANFTRERSSPTAGWSIFCNDRAIVIGDKSRLTGWGDDVPMFHPQFNIITGIIEFRSNEAKELPVTTTKRALDASSEAWLLARPWMREATKAIVGHTNKWKNHSKELQENEFKASKQVGLADVEMFFESNQVLLTQRRGTQAVLYDPVRKDVMPKPPNEDKENLRISFSRSREQIVALAAKLIDDTGAAPSDVGSAAFDDCHRRLVNGNG
jgi:hypothetical protein